MIPGRRRRLGAAALALLLAVWGGGCESPDRTPASAPPEGGATPAPGRVVDDAGRAWEVSSPPPRIVSLVPAATATLLALGEGHRLVGRTDYDEDPSLAGLPSVGGGLGPSLEVLLSLRPDFVIRFEGPSDPETPRRLDAVGIPHLGVRPDRIDDVVRMTRMLGALTGAEAAAEEVVAGIQGELEAVARAVGPAPRPRVGILLGGDPPWVAAGGTFIDEVVLVAGGDNVFADVGPLYAPVSVEEVLRRNPELLLLTEGARIPSGLRGLPVVRAPGTLQSPGPELGATARAVARLLHPDRVP